MPGRAIRVEELHVQRPVDRKHKMLLLPFSSCKAPGRKGGGEEGVKALQSFVHGFDLQCRHKKEGLVGHSNDEIRHPVI
jgi:hypothetical protein